MDRPGIPHPTQLRYAAGLLAEILKRKRPADALLDAHFRAHRSMGRRDRAQLTTLVYHPLRHARRYRALLGEAIPAWLAATLLEAFELPPEALVRYALGEAESVQQRLLQSPMEALPWDLAHNLPGWLAEEWPALLPEAEWRAAAAALQQPAPVDFRINRHRAERARILAELSARGIAAEPTPFAPDGLRLARRLSMTDPLLTHGSLIPQDEGSQWLVACLPLAPGERVLDYCAGAGGKALALADRLSGSGTVTATDADAARLARLPPRARRAGVAIEVVAMESLGDRCFDGVLVDAPCSGSGTLRRAPERALDTPDLAALSRLQGEILDRAAGHVAPGGWLVYATCSLSARENEAVAETFLATHPAFIPEPLALPEGGRAPRLRLWPHRHGTDGFFAAGFRRAG